MKDLYDSILTILKNQVINFQEFEHRPVYTSKEASEVSEHLEEESTKCIVLQSPNKIFVVTVAANEKIDYSAIKKLVGEKKISMMPTERLNQVLGIEIGAVSPFGYESAIELIVSSTLLKQEYIYINPGLNNITLRMRGSEFERVMKHCNAIIYIGS